MADTYVVIPDRDVFKASEVCEIASVQPYVLRSWESEFPSIGQARSPGAPRVYRRADVERVLQIKELVFVEGLTLAGARRRIEDEEAPADAAAHAAVVTTEMRQRLDGVKQELRALLSMLDEVKTPARTGAWPPVPQTSFLAFDAGAVDGGGVGARKSAGERRKAPRAR